MFAHISWNRLGFSAVRWLLHGLKKQPCKDSAEAITAGSQNLRWKPRSKLLHFEVWLNDETQVTYFSWWVRQQCSQQSRRKGTGAGLGKRQRDYSCFKPWWASGHTFVKRWRTKVTKESWVPKCILQKYLGCQGKCLTRLLVSQQSSKW